MLYCLHKCFDQIEHKSYPYIYSLYITCMHTYIYSHTHVHYISFYTLSSDTVHHSVLSLLFSSLPFSNIHTDRSSVWWFKSGSNLTCSAPSIGCFVGKSKFPFHVVYFYTFISAHNANCQLESQML